MDKKSKSEPLFKSLFSTIDEPMGWLIASGPLSRIPRWEPPTLEIEPNHHYIKYQQLFVVINIFNFTDIRELKIDFLLFFSDYWPLISSKIFKG